MSMALHPQRERDFQQRRVALSAQATQPLLTSAVSAHTLRPRPAVGQAATIGMPLKSRLSAMSLLLACELAYVLLNIGDLVTTYVGLHRGLTEGNPLMHNLLMRFGFGALISYKVAVVAVVIVGLSRLYAWRPRAAYLTVGFCNALVLGAVILNILQFSLR